MFKDGGCCRRRVQEGQMTSHYKDSRRFTNILLGYLHPFYIYLLGIFFCLYNYIVSLKYKRKFRKKKFFSGSRMLGSTWHSIFGMFFEVWGTNYFSLFVSYRFTSNKTQLTEFPESKSDMPLFLWVLALK